MLARVTFEISASSFAANMAIKQNSIDYTELYPLAAEVVQECFMLMTV